ncbi:MAG TPA: penicillin-binding protein activator [Motiliproteus sp.]
MLTLLSGCAPGPQRPTIEPASGDIATTEPGRELSEIEQLLLQAETAPPLAKAQYTLEAVARLIDENRLEQARTELEQVNQQLLSAAQQQYWFLLQSELSSAEQQPAAALEWIGRIQQPELLQHEQQQRLASLRADNLGLISDRQSATLTLIEQSATIPAEQQQVISDQIWAELGQFDNTALQQLLARPNDYLLQGWLELSLLSRDNDYDIQQRSDQLAEWYSLWSLHPAAQHLPTALQPLRSVQAEPLHHIALLLPQSGPLAKPARAMIEGFMAAHYQSLQRGHNVPLISFFDSATIQDLDLFYLQAELRGIDLIVGPLDKEQLNRLATRPLLGITTLGMNYVEESAATADLYQFGLRGEDEAVQSARRAWQDGHRVALTLTPATAWGDRIKAAFEQEWLQLGGAIADSERFEGTNDFSKRISRLLAVDQSEARADAVRQLVGEKVEFEARRRQDLDFIFLTALSKDARQIKPTLAFYFAADLPVYASSHVYEGQPDPTRDRDLDGIQFSESPWSLTPEIPLRADIERNRDDSRSRFGRLYALGADAYRLAPYLLQLQAQPEQHLNGLSGTLQVNASGEVSRLLDWAVFRNGKVRLLPSL